jgi:ribosomal protein S18 acetylase RimI-like enzyme
VSNIGVIDYKAPVEVLMEFADACLRIARVQDVVYSFIDIPEEHSLLIDHFQSIGYNVIAYSLRMNRNLGDYEKQSCKLRADKVEREEVLDFIDKLKECMSGSKDNMLNIILDNIRNLPEEFIDHWYNSTNIYSLYDDESFVGILELSPQGLNIANIGVDPEQRGKGYGREIMKFALNTLREQGVDTARLRVHAENERAIHLYESFGMTRGNSYKALIWRK